MSSSRRAALRYAAVVGLLGVALASCATRPTRVDPAELPEPLPDAIARFARPGGWAVDAQAGAIVSQYGCTVEYVVYRSAGVDLSDYPGGRPLVVLAHGFLRSLESMRGWAHHWASWGVDTVAVSFCNSTPFAGNHDRNADDLVAVAAELAPGSTPVVYAGFSAGGLSALLAADADRRATAYLGLDAVDSGAQSERVVRLRMPALYLFAEPGSCNADANMARAMPASSPLLALRIPFTTHCDFEHPTDRTCERFCGRIEPEDAQTAIAESVRSLATAWIVMQAGADPSARMTFAPDSRADLERRRRIVTLHAD
ncbi:MAG: hypothetical protein EA382_12525 [Spirochaetaceae bacterium]|nr:MAG: hypothetical protein EA382_12525 [Spirochaetaceae bacterium]